MDRIGVINSYIDECELFADVGCDHGYCAEYALKSGKCKRAIISDISAKSLQKAQTLLAPYIKAGVCLPVCCDGLEKIDRSVNQVLIAGMGGMEIISVLQKSFIPEKFILQPMKNADKVRAYLLSQGCKITADDIFYDEKFYFIIKGERGGGTPDNHNGTPAYSDAELAFGRDSLKNPLFKKFAAEEIAKNQARLTGLENAEGYQKITKYLNLLKEAFK